MHTTRDTRDVARQACDKQIGDVVRCGADPQLSRDVTGSHGTENTLIFASTVMR